MKRLTFPAAICMILAMYACKDKNPDPEPASTMNINIISPLQGSQYNHDDTVWMKASVSSSFEIQVINLRVSKVSNDSLLYSKQVLTSSKSATISEYFINELDPHADLFMTVQTTDKDGKETGKKQVQFHCHEH